ncbi:arsenate reductase/protein-tyrosine-phosphatase family protein [Rugosimonospora africana]|nr:phosphotyrosine protein phosphatase [Rugosimonospora africana]
MPPFSVLHVCMGNICRSPMAERLTMMAARERVGDKVDELIYVSSGGTGGWHAGEEMNPPAAREVRRRGGHDVGFAARKLLGEHLDTADLVLASTAEQVDYILGLRADSAGRTFVLGEFGRLLGKIDQGTLPPYAPEPDPVYARGVALVEAVDRVRGGQPPEAEDDLDDPWGRGDAFFSRVADEIDATVRPLVAALLAG